MMKLIRQKDAAGRLPEKENRRSSLRGILGLALLALGVLLMAGGLRTRTYTQERRYDTAYTVNDMVITASHGEDDQTSEEETNTDTETQTNTGRKITFTADMKKDPSYEVTFVSNSSGVRKIAETEKTYEKDDLEGRITEMELQKMNPQQTGEWVPVENGEEVVVGNNYNLKVHFEGSVNGFTGFEKTMHWSLGENVKCEAKEGAVMDGTKQIGTYKLTENGDVEVEFFDFFLEGGNQELDMDFEMIPTGIGEGENNNFPWEGKIGAHTIVDNTADLEVQKTAGSYNHSTGSISYTVEATVTAGMVNDGKLKDVMEEGLSFRNIEDMKVYDSNGVDVTEDYKSYIDDLKAQAQEHERKGEREWTLFPLPPLSQGMRFVVEYKGEVAQEKRTDKNYVAKNEVYFDGTKPDGESAKQAKDDAEKPLAKDQVKKTGDKIMIGEGENAHEVIQWKVRIGSGQWNPLETDLTVEDTLGDGLTFCKDEKIKVQRYDVNGVPKGDPVEIDWDSNGVTFSNDDKTIKYEIKKQMFTDYEWVDGDYLMVTYDTDFDPDKQPVDGYSNTVKTNIWAPEGVDGRLPVGEAIQKTVLDNEKEGYLEYTVVVDVPPASHMKSMIGDSGDGHPDLDLPYFYIQDKLDFDNQYALNVPKDVEIKVESKSSEKEWTFEYAPYTSGNGDGQARETFQILEGPNTPDQNEGKNLRYFRIYFNTARYGVGTNGSLDKHDSIWDIDEASCMTITYKIPYDTILVDKDGKELEMTLGELLSTGEELENYVQSRRSGVDLDAQRYWKKTPEGGDIDKLARYLSDGVVEYRVSFANWKPNDTGSRLISDKDDNRNYELLQPTLTDVFDERMEYVPNSLRVEVCNQDNDIYAVYAYTGPGPIDDNSKNTLKVNMLDFNDQTENDGEHYTDSESIEATFDSTRKYVFVYQLRLKEEYRKDWEPDENIKNDATFQYGDKKPKDSTYIDIPSDMLQKDLKTTEKGTLEYTLNVNSLAANLVQVPTGESFVNMDSYMLVDEMSDNLDLVTDENNDYKITVEYETSVGSGEWLPLQRSTNREGISKDSCNYYRGTGENNSIYFILPDELHIQIRYEVIVNGPANSHTLAQNTAKLYADYTETDEKKTVFDVGKSGATGHSDPTVRLEKKDSQNGNLLSGAGFTLYCSDENAEGADRNEPITVTKDGENITLYKVGTYETDKDGEIKKIPRPVEADPNAFYALLETKVPEGYSMLPGDEIRFFRFPDYDNPVEGGTVTYREKSYEIQPMKANGTITVNNTPDEYVLPETGGPGTAYLYLLGSLLMAAGGLFLLNERRLARRK